MISRLRLQPADVGMGMTSQRVRDRRAIVEPGDIGDRPHARRHELPAPR